MYLASNIIKKLIKEENLVSDYINFDEQLQPDGFDLTVNKLCEFTGCGVLLKDTKILAPTKEIPTIDNLNDFLQKQKDCLYLQMFYEHLPFYKDKQCWYLPKGVYQIHFNETIKLPQSISALHIERSTIMRNGNDTAIGTWDMGYNGKGMTLLEILNPYGFVLEKDSRVVKMHFITVLGEGKLYNGNYQNENL